ncbi:MAG: hypothetical protein LAO04_16375 [Acidobacteriia bacterium]|nr:hypothetical protein [Terriglobia bacterium]
MAIPEWAYYPAVQSYLRRLGYVCESKGSGGKVIPFIMKGSGQIILDVFGIRTPGSPFSSELEVAAVEVKRSTSRASLRYMHQALNSSKIAHKCYLAMPRKYTDKDLKMAAELGIGLLTIRGRNQVRLESESRRFDPNESSLLEFLRRNLAIAKCGICGNFASLFDLPEGHHREGGGWRTNAFLRKGKKKWVYFCRQCRERFENVWPERRMLAAERKLQALAAHQHRLRKQLHDLRSTIRRRRKK